MHNSSLKLESFMLSTDAALSYWDRLSIAYDICSMLGMYACLVYCFMKFYG